MTEDNGASEFAEEDVEDLEENGLRSEFSVFDDLPSATHWPSLAADEVVGEWEELREWVEALRARFAALDHHVIPACWWRHNGHVEALAALRDHERVCYSDTAPASAPVDWMRSLRDIAHILASWTAELACGARHEDPSPVLRAPYYQGWEDHCRGDQQQRGRASGGDEVEE